LDLWHEAAAGAEGLMSWSRRFDELIELPDGRKLRTLKEAIAWLAKEIPKSEHTMVNSMLSDCNVALSD